VPKLNLNVSVLSDLALVIGCDNERFKGPTGVIQSIAIPAELLIYLFHLMMSHNQHPIDLRHQRKIKNQYFDFVQIIEAQYY